MTEITFLVHEAEEGGYHAEAAGFGILAEGDTMSELKENIKGGISLYFEGSKNYLNKFSVITTTKN